MTALSNIFCIQDRSGTAVQLTLEVEAPEFIDVGDTGTYFGLDWEGRDETLDFTVGQIIGPLDIGITTLTPTGGPGQILRSGWPKMGIVTWVTGMNSLSSPRTSFITGMQPANAYTSVSFFMQYCNSRNYSYPASPVEPIQQAIVNGTDYLDQRYRFKGVKLLQFINDNLNDPMIGYIDPWLMPFGYLGGGPNAFWNPLWTPSTTSQKTQFPRQGVVDYSGDTVYGVPQAIQEATCELAIRNLNGVNLQPDYDPTLVGEGGGVASSISQEVGPIKVTRSFDTKLGLSFFPDFPHVRRILSQAGLLLGGGGRSIMR